MRQLDIILWLLFFFGKLIIIHTFALPKSDAVKWMDEYMIPFYSLKEGIHNFSFEAGNKFFEHFDNPDIRGGNINVDLSFNKKSGFLELNFKIQGFLIVICDRCLENFKYSIITEETLYVRFGDEAEEETDNVIIIPREETRINVAQYIYEFSALSLPVQKIHPVINDISGCNKEMLKKLEEHQNKESENIDPRWEELLKLRNKKK